MNAGRVLGTPIAKRERFLTRTRFEGWFSTRSYINISKELTKANKVIAVAFAALTHSTYQRNFRIMKRDVLRAVVL